MPPPVPGGLLKEAASCLLSQSGAPSCQPHGAMRTGARKPDARRLCRRPGACARCATCGTRARCHFARTCSGCSGKEGQCPFARKPRISGFPGGSVVKNPPADAGDRLSPRLGRTPHAWRQLALCTTASAPLCPRACALQQEKPSTTARGQPPPYS